MARVSTYLNFPRSTEEAFLFYKSVFGTEFDAPIARFKDMPPAPDQPPLAEADQNLVMHVALPILGGHVLMGTDAPESMGFTVTPATTYTSTSSPTRAPKPSVCSMRLRPGAGSRCRCRRCSGATISTAWLTASGYIGCSTAPASPDRSHVMDTRNRTLD